MHKFYVVLELIGTCSVLFIIGQRQIFTELREHQAKLNFVREYQQKYSEFIDALFNKRSFNNSCYNWLQYNLTEMQGYLGDHGTVTQHIPAMGIISRNFQLLPNVLPMLRTVQQDFYRAQLLETDDRAFDVQDVLIRYLGVLRTEENQIISRYKNKAVCFQQGVQAIITLPISILLWSGLLQYQSFARWTNNSFVRFCGFCITMIGLISSLITIITGLNPVEAIIKNSSHQSQPKPR